MSGSSPEGETNEPDGVVTYANDAFVLCGNRLCGGPLDIPAASDAGGRPSHAFSVTRAVVEISPS